MKPSCYFLAVTWSDSPVSTHYRALGEELARRGHQIVFIVDKQNKQVENHESNPAVYSWPSSRPTKLKDALFLRRLIKQYKPECVMGAFGSANLVLLVGWWMRVPNRVACYLTLADQLKVGSSLNRLKLRILQLRKKLIYTLATHIVPNSAAGSTDVQKVYGVPSKKCNVLYLSLPDPKPELGELTISEERNGLICVGRLHPAKGQDVLLRAIAKLKDQFPETIFEFVGDGPCKDECLRLAKELGIEDRCRFVGFLPLDEVIRRMAASAVSVVPSRSECFGLVNIESLAVGTPVVASNVGGISEIFDDGEEGFLVPPDDPEMLAMRLAEILSNPQLRHEMSDKAQLRFQRFEQKNVVNDQVNWLESLEQKTMANVSL